MRKGRQREAGVCVWQVSVETTAVNYTHFSLFYDIKEVENKSALLFVFNYGSVICETDFIDVFVRFLFIFKLSVNSQVGKTHLLLLVLPF